MAWLSVEGSVFKYESLGVVSDCPYLKRRSYASFKGMKRAEDFARFAEPVKLGYGTIYFSRLYKIVIPAVKIADGRGKGAVIGYAPPSNSTPSFRMDLRVGEEVAAEVSCEGEVLEGVVWMPPNLDWEATLTLRGFSMPMETIVGVDVELCRCRGGRTAFSHRLPPASPAILITSPPHGDDARAQSYSNVSVPQWF